MGSTATRVMAVVSQLAAGQWGMLTTAQAEREGVTRLQLARLADAGVLERVDRGVYATAAASAAHRGLHAAWLALEPKRTAEERLADPIAAGVASHTSAAGLHRLGDLLDDEPELTLPHRKQSRRGIRLHRATLADSDVTLVDGLPTTTEERTVADLLRDGHDPEHVAQIIGQGARRGVIDLSDLAAHVESSARRYGQANGTALVEHLLDLVGLSSSALARELANSPVGKGLVAAGRVGAFSDLLESLVPRFDMATVSGLDKLTAGMLPSFNVSQLVDLRGITEVMKPLQTQLASPAITSSMQAMLQSIASSSAFRDAAQVVQSPAFRTAIEAAIKATAHSTASDTDRRASQADTAHSRPKDAEDER